MLTKIRCCLMHWNAKKITILLVTLGVKHISDFLDIPLSSSAARKQSDFKSKLSKIRKEKYLNEWYSAKQAYSVSKLDTSTNIKNSFGFEIKFPKFPIY